jgi:hypothetical protein
MSAILIYVTGLDVREKVTHTAREIILADKDVSVSINKTKKL